MAKRRSNHDILYTEMMGDHLIPFYRIETADGSVFEVPKHIRRIYSIKNGKVNISGWQIAFNRKQLGIYNPFFSDKDRGPWIALEKATNDLRRFLQRTPNTKQSGLKIKETKRTIYKTGMPGIRIEWRFGRRNALYDLKIEARAGAYNPKKAKLFYVGTEFSANEERLRWALNEALRFRREHLSFAAANGQTFPRLRKQPRLEVDIERVFEVLRYHKEQHVEKLDEIAIEKASRWMAQKRLYMTFRNYRFYAKQTEFGYTKLKVPEFIWLEEGLWHCEYPLPDGEVHYEQIPVSKDPVSDITRLIADCFFESMMTSIPAPVDRLFSDSPQQLISSA